MPCRFPCSGAHYNTGWRHDSSGFCGAAQSYPHNLPGPLLQRAFARLVSLAPLRSWSSFLEISHPLIFHQILLTLGTIWFYSDICNTPAIWTSDFVPNRRSLQGDALTARPLGQISANQVETNLLRGLQVLEYDLQFEYHSRVITKTMNFYLISEFFKHGSVGIGQHFKESFLLLMPSSGATFQAAAVESCHVCDAKEQVAAIRDLFFMFTWTLKNVVYLAIYNRKHRYHYHNQNDILLIFLHFVFFENVHFEGFKEYD